MFDKPVPVLRLGDTLCSVGAFPLFVWWKNKLIRAVRPFFEASLIVRRRLALRAVLGTPMTTPCGTFRFNKCRFSRNIIAVQFCHYQKAERQANKIIAQWESFHAITGTLEVVDFGVVLEAS